MKKWLFLKWCLINILTGVILYFSVQLGSSQVNNLSLVGKLMVDVIIFLYIVTTIYCGYLCWQTDTILENLEDAAHDSPYRYDLKKKLFKLNHQADHISFASNECPYIGLLGAIIGIYYFMTGSAGLGGAPDPAHIKEVMSNALVAIGIAFIPTITGIFFRSILSWEHHMITHEIAYSLKEHKMKKKHKELIDEE
jgi:hypothetical protein